MDIPERLKKETSIVIVGAGVIGMTIALVLKQQGYEDVTIVAEHLPVADQGGNSPYYTSTKAGAHFRPQPATTPSEVRQSEYTRKTYRFFQELAQKYPESSIKFMRGYDWIDDPTPEYRELQHHYRKGMDNFEEVKTDGLAKSIKMAVGYDTWVLNAPLYVNFLYRHLVFHYGVKFVRKRLDSLQAACTLFPEKAVDVIFNASAVGLLYKGGHDPACFPIKGQTLVLRVPPDSPYLTNTITHQVISTNEWIFTIPRPCDGGLIVGTTREIGNTDPAPSQEATAVLLGRAKRIFPGLFVDGRPPPIVSVNVGFRPGRKGGSRVEAESIDGRQVVHAYGIAGMGFEASYGMALDAVRLLKEKIGTPQGRL